MTPTLPQTLSPISAPHLAYIRRLWDIRRCYICERLGLCPHRELQVELAEMAAASRRAGKHSPSPTRT